jgi:toxin HigB-1
MWKAILYDAWKADRGPMIESFKHKGLRQLFEDDNARGVSAEHLRKIKQILAVLDAADVIDALRLPTFGLHPLKGDLKGFWAVTVRANWRIIFRFDDGKASDVDLVDYH